MIFDELIALFNDIVMIILNLIPDSSLASIPIIGDDIQSILLWIVTTWNAFLVTVPYFQIVWDLFIYAIYFEICIIILKFWLGSRTPVAE